MNDALRQEITDFYRRYIAAFRAGDSTAMAAMVATPLARIGPASVELVSAPPDPAALKARTGWADTREVEVEVLDATPERANLRLKRAVRVRADGSVIETIAGVYALTRAPDGWKILAMSVVATPATPVVATPATPVVATPA